MIRVPLFSRLKRKRIRLFFVFIFTSFLISAELASAGILVAPTSVVLTEKDRTGRMTIQNPTDKPKEVSVNFAFGIPESDSLGNVTVVMTDSAAAIHPRSAINWVKAFPRRVVLAPGATQVVRFVANPPDSLSDGEYWCRIMVRSQESQANLPAATDKDKITTQLNMVMQTAIVLKYRKGNLLAKLEITDKYVEETDTTVSLIVDLANRGNVSYVGRLICRLLDADKKEIAFRNLDFAVYDDLKRRITLAKTHATNRRPYEFNVTISTDGRNDLPPEDVIPGNRIEFTQTVH